jgi:hypothetical protein
MDTMSWIIDPTTEHYVDVMIDVVPTGQRMDRQSVVRMIRNLIVVDDNIAEVYDGKPLTERRLREARNETCCARVLVGAKSHITLYNRVLRTTPGSGTARANSGDFGTMYAIGARIAKKTAGTHIRTVRMRGGYHSGCCRIWLSAWDVVARSTFPRCWLCSGTLNLMRACCPFHQQWRGVPVSIAVLDTPLT